MGFSDDLAAAKAAVGSGERLKTVPIPVTVNGQYYEFVFYRSDPERWSAVTLQHTPREGVDLDRRYGYNLAGVTRAIAVEDGRRLEDGAEVSMTAEEWADLFTVLPGPVARTIEANVWNVNERQAELEIERAKKASARRSKRKSS